jgi:hypothetical protein
MGIYADNHVLFDNDQNAIIDGLKGNGVVSGCAVTSAEDDMTVDIAAGVVIANGTRVAVSGTFKTCVHDDANPVRAIIVVGADGTVDIVHGAAAAAKPVGSTGSYTSEPIPPNIPADHIILADVWIPAAETIIDSDYITDRRVLISPPTLQVPTSVGGTADAITAVFAPVLLLAAEPLVAFLAAGANTITNPTFNPDGLGAGTIFKYGGTVLAVGDIPAEHAVVILKYNLAHTRWELLNPKIDPAALPKAGGTMTGNILFAAGVALQFFLNSIQSVAMVAHGNAGAAHTINWTESWNQSITLDNDTAFTFTDPGTTGCPMLHLLITHDVSGSTWTPTWTGGGTTVLWIGGAPVFATSGGVYAATFWRTSANNYIGACQRAY